MGSPKASFQTMRVMPVSTHKRGPFLNYLLIDVYDECPRRVKSCIENNSN